MADNVAVLSSGGRGRDVLPVISPSEWCDKPIPSRFWLMEGWLPMMRATLLTGDGGSGKSLVAQQMATCVALGLPFLGTSTRQVNALYITCEDDRGELHRRQAAICRSLGVSLADLERKMFLLSRCGDLDNSLLHFAVDGLTLSQFYQQLDATVKDREIGFLVLDNIAHLFEGNENIRQHVAVFCSALEALCRANAPLTILFLGHPSKAGAQFSGSTAWENQVRSRIYLERPKDDGCLDEDVRVLSRAKANYAKVGETIAMKWQDWAFVEHDSSGGDWHQQMASSATATQDNELFLKLLALREGQGRTVSARPRAPNYAPREFAKMPQSKGKTIEQFERAMERLFSIEHIKEIDHKSAVDRHVYRRLVATAGQSAGQWETAPQSDDRQHLHSPNSEEKRHNGTLAGQWRGRSAGQSMTGPQDDAQSGSNAREMNAGQSRASSGAEGAGGEPPIGGLIHPPSPAASEGWDWLDPNDGLPPMGEDGDDD